MAYESKDFEVAKRRLDARRAAALERQSQNKMIAFARFPRLSEIESEMRKLGASLVSALAKGTTDKTTAMDTMKDIGDKLTQERERILRDNNLPADFLLPQYTCKECNDTGAVAQKRCDCFLKLLKQVQLERINGISKMNLCSFSHFDLNLYSDTPQNGEPSNRQVMNGVFSYCKNYAQNFNLESDSLLMLGSTGLGKTHLSLSIAKEVIDKGYSVIYGSLQNLMSAMEKEHFSPDFKDEDTLNSLLSCDLLILDDLGTEFTTAFVTAYLYNIINTRLSLHLPTIVNSNLSYMELEQLYSARICSRLMGGYREIPFYGEDIRIKLGDQNH